MIGGALVIEGIYPEFEFLRRTFHAAGGRFLNGKDLKERKRVVFLGGPGSPGVEEWLRDDGEGVQVARYC